MANDARVKITLVCTECKQRNYDTKKNKKNDPDRLELKKYCRFCRKHTLHKESKYLGGLMKMAEEKNVAPAEKQPKPKKEKQKGKVKNAWKGFKSEIKKVAWPSWKQVLKGSAVVLAVVSVCAVAIGALDFAFQEGITAIVKLFS